MDGNYEDSLSGLLKLLESPDKKVKSESTVSRTMITGQNNESVSLEIEPIYKINNKTTNKISLRDGFDPEFRKIVLKSKSKSNIYFPWNFLPFRKFEKTDTGKRWKETSRKCVSTNAVVRDSYQGITLSDVRPRMLGNTPKAQETDIQRGSKETTCSYGDIEDIDTGQENGAFDFLDEYENTDSVDTEQCSEWKDRTDERRCSENDSLEYNQVTDVDDIFDSTADCTKNTTHTICEDKEPFYTSKFPERFNKITKTYLPTKEINRCPVCGSIGGTFADVIPHETPPPCVDYGSGTGAEYTEPEEEDQTTVSSCGRRSSVTSPSWSKHRKSQKDSVDRGWFYTDRLSRSSLRYRTHSTPRAVDTMTFRILNSNKNTLGISSGPKVGKGLTFKIGELEATTLARATQGSRHTRRAMPALKDFVQTAARPFVLVNSQRCAAVKVTTPISNEYDSQLNEILGTVKINETFENYSKSFETEGEDEYEEYSDDGSVTAERLSTENLELYPHRSSYRSGKPKTPQYFVSTRPSAVPKFKTPRKKAPEDLDHILDELFPTTSKHIKDASTWPTMEEVYSRKYFGIKHRPKMKRWKSATIDTREIPQTIFEDGYTHWKNLIPVHL